MVHYTGVLVSAVAVVASGLFVNAQAPTPGQADPTAVW